MKTSPKPVDSSQASKYIKGIIIRLVELLRALLDLIGRASITTGTARSSTTASASRTTVGSGDNRVGNTKNIS